MPHIPLDGLQEVEDEIGPSLELDLDAAPTFFDHVPILYQAVVNRYQPHGEYENDTDENQQGNHEEAPFIKTQAFSTAK